MATHRTIAQWQDIILNYNSKERTVIDYCKSHQIAVSCFYKWKRKFKQEQVQNHSTVFDPVIIVDKVAEKNHIELAVNGIVITGTDKNIKKLLGIKNDY